MSQLTTVAPPGRRRLRLHRPGVPRGPQWWRNLPPRWRLALRLGLAAVAVGCLLLGSLVAYAAMTLPNIDDIGRHTGTMKILDARHQTVAELGIDNVNRTEVPLDKVAKVMQQATIAAEDRNFYNEGAFNIPRIAKALFVDVIARRPQQGASTITQQLAKQAFFINESGGADRSPLRKLREALVANEIDRRYSKDEILDKYLNIIYYGEGAYGVENASQAYFGRHASELNLAEASMLAGLPQAPSYNDPHVNPQTAFARQHYVLVGLVDTGVVSQQAAAAVDPLNPDGATAQANQQAILADLNNGKPVGSNGLAPHFAQYVRDQIHDLFHDDPAVLNTSVTVETGLDLDLQRQAQDAVRKGVDAIGHKANNGALLMLDANTGDIKAFVGSKDFNDATIGGQYDVITAQRRPGSSFKPYVYEEGFKEHALRPTTILNDTPAQSAKLGGVKDFDRSFMGPMPASRALLLSRNVPAEQAMTIAGVPQVIDFAHQLGITSPLAPNAGTAIGQSAVKMIEHTAAYAAFANGGHLYSPRAILKVTNSKGEVLYDAGQAHPAAEVMSPVEAYAITKILVNYPSQWGLGIRHQTAGKSGTTDDFVDAWYMAYTPNMVVATWAGHTEAANPGEVGMDGVYGTTVGRQVAAPFINSLPSQWFRPFSVSGSLGGCTAGDASLVAEACPTPTRSSTPTPASSETATPSETSTSTQLPLATPPILPLRTPPPSPASTPTASPSTGGGAPNPSPSPT